VARSGSFASKLRNTGVALHAFAGEIPERRSETVATHKEKTLSALIEMDLLKVILTLPDC
jgi:hypothetical protein